MNPVNTSTRYWHDVDAEAISPKVYLGGKVLLTILEVIFLAGTVAGAAACFATNHHALAFLPLTLGTILTIVGSITLPIWHQESKEADEKMRDPLEQSHMAATLREMNLDDVNTINFGPLVRLGLISRETVETLKKDLQLYRKALQNRKHFNEYKTKFNKTDRDIEHLNDYKWTITQIETFGKNWKTQIAAIGTQILQSQQIPETPLVIPTFSSKNASKWENWLDSKEYLNAELAGKIVMIAVGIIALAGIAVACYYLCTTTVTTTTVEHGVSHTYQQSNAPLIFLPIIFGGVPSFALIIGGACWIHSSKKEEQKQRQKLLNDPTARMKFEENLKGINNLGNIKKIFPNLGPQVRAGKVTIEEAEKIRFFEREYRALAKSINQYEQRSTPLTAQLKSYPQDYPFYSKNRERLTHLNQEWSVFVNKTIQPKISNEASVNTTV